MNEQTSMLGESHGTGSSGAELSDCGTYRYTLWRKWDPSLPPVLFVGLNPSTADATEDDPTIRRCVRFARDWGYGGLVMANLYAYRATDPKRLHDAVREGVGIVGPDNDWWLREVASEAGLVIAAWGATAHPGFPGRNQQVLSRLPHPHALALTKDGHPRHPLYVKADVRPVPLTGGAQGLTWRRAP